MKKLLVISIIILSVLACKKTKFSPEGPTDIRVQNISAFDFTDIIVNTSDGIDTLGDAVAGGLSEYKRFNKAYVKAEISAKINSELFYTGTVDYTGLTYIGQAKITYEVWVTDLTNKKLEMRILYPLDGPLE
jgi:hypothetical protein